MDQITQSPIACVVTHSSAAVRIAPVVQALRNHTSLQPQLIATTSAKSVLRAFRQAPDQVLNLSGTSAVQRTCDLISELDRVFATQSPSALIVQGHNRDAFIATELAEHHNIPVAHLDAGRGDHGLRRAIDQSASLHLTSTTSSALQLLREGVALESVVITGSTAVDAVQAAAAQGRAYDNRALKAVEDSGRRLVFVSLSREPEDVRNLGMVLRKVLRGDRQLEIVVTSPHDLPFTLRSERLHVMRPLSYRDRARLLANSSLVVADHGEVIEEASAFDIPSFILSATTEFPEIVGAGFARVVGSAPVNLAREALDAVHGVASWNLAGVSPNPLGYGDAAMHCAHAIGWLLGCNERTDSWSVAPEKLLYAVA